MPAHRPLEERFWEKVDKRRRAKGCWLWTGAPSTWGYGQIAADSSGGKKPKPHRLYAHRVSYELNVGKIPEELLVLHTCDTPLCVNPDHLYVGTQADNISDMYQRKRGNGVVTKRRLRRILTLHQRGLLLREIADDVDVSITTVFKVVHGYITEPTAD